MKQITAILIATVFLFVSCTEGKMNANIENTDKKVNAESENSLTETEEKETMLETAFESETFTNVDETIVLAGTEMVESETAIPEQRPSQDVFSTSESDVFVMAVPTQYSQVFNKLKDANEYIVYANAYYDVIVNEEVDVAVSGGDFSTVEMIPDAEESFFNPVYTNPEDFSKTNTQVYDIDEGDILKTDGEYIYVLKDGAELLILSASGTETQIISSTKLEIADTQRAKEMYLFEDNVLILSTKRKTDAKNASWYWDVSQSCVIIDIYDISNSAEPKKIAEVGQDGNYTASRLINDDLYVISMFSIYSMEEIVREDHESYIPGLYTNGVKTLVEPSCIVYPSTVEALNYAVITRYDADTGAIELNKTVLGAGETVYLSAEHLYLADERYFKDESEPYIERNWSVIDYASGTRTEILKFDLTEDLHTEAVGYVDGMLLNQFSMDEKDGYLRVVTTCKDEAYSVYTDVENDFKDYRWKDSVRTNGLFIFDKDMEIVGKIDGLAENEQVYSVRFANNVAYFVTFRTLDPLFTVDLSDPTAPKIMSELKIAGFSEYLHPYSNGLLFGLGQDADENTGRTYGMKLSMFDISDPYNVVEQKKLSLEFSYSKALYNHKAILISAEKDLIGFPISCGYVIYGYGDEGFYERARIVLDDIYWNNDSRGLYVGEYVYIVTQVCTFVLDMEDFSIVAQISYADR